MALTPEPGNSPRTPEPADSEPTIGRVPAGSAEPVDYPDTPYVHGRDLVPIRRRHDGTNQRVQQLVDQEQQLRDEITRLDEQLLDLAARRQYLLEQARDLHNQIRPLYAACRGRRRRHPTHETPLPPVAPNPTLVIGRELRALCLTILQQAGRPLTLRHLHAHLHRAGYAIDHRHPAKALADALGHEADHHRCTRIKRGVYALTQSLPHHPQAALPDW